MKQTIDFAAFGGPVYVGRANGVNARRRVNGDKLDVAEEPVEVRIPEDAYSVNSSFFLGLFGPSLKHFGTREAFLDHYKFVAPEHVVTAIDSIMDRAISSRGRLHVNH